MPTHHFHPFPLKKNSSQIFAHKLFFPLELTPLGPNRETERRPKFKIQFHTTTPNTPLSLNIPGLGLREEVKARDGESVSLPCVVNRAECGDFHSIKWYKENRRVFVYSPMADFAKAEGELLDR